MSATATSLAFFVANFKIVSHENPHISSGNAKKCSLEGLSKLDMVMGAHRGISQYYSPVIDTNNSLIYDSIFSRNRKSSIPTSYIPKNLLELVDQTHLIYFIAAAFFASSATKRKLLKR
jgi:hypothetical protein